MAKASIAAHDRRLPDPTITALGMRVGALEGRVETLEFELKNNNRAIEKNSDEIAANTKLTEEIHGRTEEMYELFDATRNGFRMIGRIGNGAARVGRGAGRAIEATGKLAWPLVILAAFAVGTWTYLKTGHFALPEWAILK